MASERRDALHCQAKDRRREKKNKKKGERGGADMWSTNKMSSDVSEVDQWERHVKAVLDAVPIVYMFFRGMVRHRPEAV